MKRLGLCGLLAGCAAAWQLPVAPVGTSASRDGGHDYVVLSRSATVEFLGATPEEGYLLTTHSLYQVMTPAGREIARMTLPQYFDEEVVGVRGRKWSASHPPTSYVTQDDAVMVPMVPDFALYSDSRLLLLDVPGVEVGDLVEFESKVRVYGEDLPRWFFDDQVPVVESRFEVLAPATWELVWGYAENGIAQAAEPERKAGDTTQRYVWSRQQLSPWANEAFGHASETLAKQLQVGVRKVPTDTVPRDWGRVVARYQTLAADRTTLDAEALASLAAFPKANAFEPESRRAYRWVRDRIRYLALYEGIGGFQPHPASQTFSLGAGDCKDMATLLVAALASQRIEAYPVLVRTRESWLSFPGVATLGSFNHVIVAIREEQGWHYVDPTAKDFPYDVLPWEVQGQWALQVASGNSQLIQLPEAGAEANASTTAWQVSDTHIELVATLSGLEAQPFWDLVDGKDPFATRQRVRDLLAGGWDFARVLEAHVQSTGLPLGQVQVVAKVASDDTGGTLAGRKIYDLEPYLGSAGEVAVPSKRQGDVVFGYPRRQQLSVHIVVGAGDSIVAEPVMRAHTSALARIDITKERVGTGWLIKRTLERGLSEVAPEAFADIQSYVDVLAEQGRGALVVSAK